MNISFIHHEAAEQCVLAERELVDARDLLCVREAGRQEAKLCGYASRTQLKHITPRTHVSVRMTSSANIC